MRFTKDRTFWRVYGCCAYYKSRVYILRQKLRHFISPNQLRGELGCADVLSCACPLGEELILQQTGKLQHIVKLVLVPFILNLPAVPNRITTATRPCAHILTVTALSHFFWDKPPCAGFSTCSFLKILSMERSLIRKNYISLFRMSKTHTIKKTFHRKTV